MNNIPDTAIYARLSDDKLTIVEYPVLALNIRNRAHPFDWYTKVVFEPKLENKEFFSVKETLKIVDNLVFASYEYVAHTLDQILSGLYRDKNQNTPAGQAEIPVMFSDVDPKAAEYIINLADKYTERKMDDFAALKRYNGIGSACSYITSTISSFKAEAEKCVDIRDRALVALITYLNQVTSGAIPVPKSTAEIDAILPVMAW